ncbi:hypothetical protein ACFU8I_00575 [Streptomyces sp. NPDC057540]|uniref:hypothetical protein n=1 Tax=Streptomyces sp. NPDC057540 TaxID=3346160 RepID=UPI0036B71846
MADHFTDATSPVPPAELSDETRTLLTELADTLDRVHPSAAMNEAIRLARPLVLAERLHGATVAAYVAEQDLLAAMPLVRDGQTRGEYAALLRLIAEGVTQ